MVSVAASDSNKQFQDGEKLSPAVSTIISLWTSRLLRDKTWTLRLTAMSQCCCWIYWDTENSIRIMLVLSEKVVLQPCSERGWFLERENFLKRKIRAHLSKVRAGCRPRAASGTRNKFGDQFNLGRTSMCLQDLGETNNFTFSPQQRF